MITRSPVLGEPLGELSAPRRLAIVDLLGRALAAERELARTYATLAARARMAGLRTGLGELADAKAGHVTRLVPIVAEAARGLTLAGVPPDLPSDPGLPPAQGGEDFGRAFDQERTLGARYRELLALTPAFAPEIGALAAEAVQVRQRLRDLYLRYS